MALYPVVAPKILQFRSHKIEVNIKRINIVQEVIDFNSRKENWAKGAQFQSVGERGLDLDCIKRDGDRPAPVFSRETTTPLFLGSLAYLGNNPLVRHSRHFSCLFK
ncbi:hypothetical protein ABFA07_008170 [Porites harrisoni]